ncbi:aliphatic sulfonate ABC transporter substrate-binding protein [Celeribacter indicus]|uniref:Aliphatic sulfonates ABC transporter substrate-binding protein n=1 Tax=Celeribacter indicus TaxID=1208324 RepID=A0A0B5E1F1_9RHOB|nr:aliphatic sulfonate ABC transporter substrate-binding protein [Celeribacter indicus]AJE46836.1 aliphatic sulfonates ABC transporter substrate-binding protein [Celeribacter indicus]SDW80701.1 sulfonate transport system substrate-binding protein [Celeribacter indicus]
MSNVFTRRGVSLSLAAALAAAVLPVSGALAQEAAAPEVIRIGSTAPGHLKFVLFRTNGWLEREFAAEGTRIEFSTFDGGSAASVALGSGELDLMYTGNNPALRLAATGADVIAAGLSSWVPNNETVVIVRADSDIHSLEDLKGESVAYLLGTVRHSTLSKALETVGLSTSDVDTLNFGIEVSGPALDRGDVSAIVETRATVQSLIDSGFARVIFDAGEYPEWSVPFPITVSGTFARNHPEILTRLLAQDIRLSRWVDENPEETIRLFVEGTGRDEAATRETYPDGVFHQSPEFTPEAVEALRSEATFMTENDLLQGTIDYDSWIDTSYYEAALKLLDSQTN